LVSATAVTNCKLAAIPADAVLDRIRANAEVGYFLAQCQTIDAVRIQSLLLQSRLLTTEQCFFRLLLEIAAATNALHANDSTVVVTVPLSEMDIADLISMNRCAFSRMKRTLIRTGALHQAGNVFSFSRYQVDIGICTW
ncbi:MAG TPA: hypothetical protein VE621_12235, partial [Bryobacteraceae bacterium]|nr:hypothetical protein [Bryobacteraceae bacterium]